MLTMFLMLVGLACLLSIMIRSDEPEAMFCAFLGSMLASALCGFLGL